MRPPELGNFRESEGLPPLARSRAFSLWSAVKRRGVRHSLLVIGIVLVATAAAAAALARRGRPDDVRRRGAALLALAAIAAAELLVPPFAQGAWGIERVLFGFHVVFDLCVISLVLLAAGGLASRAFRPAARLAGGA
jgi:hypothetical protein